jgi:hypothetical protein
MNVQRLLNCLRNSAAAVLALASLWPAPALAQADHQHTISAPQQQDLNSAQGNKGAELARIVRNATVHLQTVEDAENANYFLMFGCVSGGDFGAMGLHYVNGDLLKILPPDPNQPPILIFEPQPNGKPKLTGADFLIDSVTWHKDHKDPPELMGQLFHLFESPNRFALDTFYTLHVWAWKENPNGTFVNWHPNVSCDAFTGKK